MKAIFLVLAPLGLVTLWLAVFADMGTSLLVTGQRSAPVPPLTAPHGEWATGEAARRRGPPTR